MPQGAYKAWKDSIVIHISRLFAAVAVAMLCSLLAAPVVAGKEGVRARLEAPVPLSAQQGEKITIAWSLFYKDRSERRPFGAGGLFVRLLSASGEQPTRAHGEGRRGRYVADVTVPEGGIGGIEFGLEGTRYVGGMPDTGRAENADVFFPIVNDPFEQQGGATPATSSPPRAPDSGEGLATWLVVAGVLAAGVAFLKLRRTSMLGRRRLAG